MYPEIAALDAWILAQKIVIVTTTQSLPLTGRIMDRDDMGITVAISDEIHVWLPYTAIGSISDPGKPE